MTPTEVRAAREALGLTQAQLAALLGYSTRGNASARVSEIEARGKAMDEARARLLRAYLAGYRPGDWPEPAAAPEPKAKRGAPPDA